MTDTARKDLEIALLRAVANAVKRENRVGGLITQHALTYVEAGPRVRKKLKAGLPSLEDQWQATQRDLEEAMAALEAFDSEGAT